MAEYLHPGVYVEEVSSGVRPIEGVGTSTAGFIGITAKGVPNLATFITSWAEFVRKFGDLISNSYLPYAVSQYFSNGGKKCYVVRVLSDASSVAAWVNLPDRQVVAARNTLRVNAKGKGAWGNSLSVRVEDGTEDPTGGFKLVVLLERGGKQEVVEVHDNLSMDTAAANYVETEINGASEYIEVRDRNSHLPQPPDAARRTTAGALADPVAFNANETLVLEATDGEEHTVTFPGSLPRADALAAINAAIAPVNVTAELDNNNRLVIRHNEAGYDRYFILSGTATGAGRPLAGLAGFAQGNGPAIGGTVKSAIGPTFDTSGGNNELEISVDDDILPPITLTEGAAVPIATILSEIRAGLDAPANRGLARVSQEGNRLVIATANKGNHHSKISVGGSADTNLEFRGFDRGGASGDPVAGKGRSDPAFIQSAPGPFALSNNDSFTIVANNDTLGEDSTFTVTFTSGAIPNLQAVSAQAVANAINASAAGEVDASVVNNRVIVRQSRRGNYYRLQLNPVPTSSPNIRLQFQTSRRFGYAEGDKSSPYYRPNVNDVTGVNQPRPLTRGDDGSPVSAFDYEGVADKKTGLHALDDIKDVNFLAIPGIFDPGVVGAAVGYCTIRKDCFFIADPPGKETKDTPITEPVQVRNFLLNGVPTKTSYGALYYPWLEIGDPIGAGKNPKRFVPPSGFVAGLYARTDNNRGVWKAPAGTEATVIGALDLEYSVTDAEQDILNPIGVNCLREFPASGLVIWGARTMGTQNDPEWRYVPVRRYAIYLEQSIYRGTQWAVFEPNDETLWASLKANIEDFMMGEFRKGALAGVTPEQAFFVKCDVDLNPPSEVNAGRVNMEVQFAPLRPAEFVIIRISQKVQRPEG